MSPADPSLNPPAAPAPAPASQAALREAPELIHKLEWVMFVRVILLTVLFGSALALNVGGGDPVVNPLRLDFIRLIVGTYLLTIVYALALRRLERGLVRFAWVQLIIDLLIGAVVVSLTGGSESLFLFLYLLTVLQAAFLLFRRGATYASAVATALVVLQVAREATGLGLAEGAASDAELRDIFLSGLANISAIFMVGLLAGYLSEQLRDAGQRLRDASEDLAALKALNEHIITSVRSGLISYTLDHQIIFVNPAAEQLLSRDTASLLYGDVTRLLPDLAPLEAAGGHPRTELRYPHPDGRDRTLGISLSPLLDSLGTHQGWILVFQDLTPLKEMAEAVRRSEKLAAVGRLAAGLAHEIRNPLAGMTSSIQLLERGDLGGPMAQRLLGILSREADRLSLLLTEFLRYARPGPPQVAPCELREVLREVVEVLQAQHAERLAIALEAPEALPLQADHRQLRQVFWNLLNNAAEVSSRGGQITVRAKSLPAPGGVEVQILDEGPGIAADLLEKIFEPFFTTKASGTGLGLALVQRIVEDHGGRLRVESVEGAGSVFTVALPARPPDAVGPSEPAEMEARK